jgi:hypothetical protein
MENAMPVDLPSHRNQRVADRATAECVCPGCKRLLQIEELKVLQFSDGSKEMLFCCDRCGSTATKTIEIQ